MPDARGAACRGCPARPGSRSARQVHDAVVGVHELVDLDALVRRARSGTFSVMHRDQHDVLVQHVVEVDVGPQRQRRRLLRRVREHRRAGHACQARARAARRRSPAAAPRAPCGGAVTMRRPSCQVVITVLIDGGDEQRQPTAAGDLGRRWRRSRTSSTTPNSTPIADQLPARPSARPSAATMRNSVVSIRNVPVTAKPYSVASRLDERNASISTQHAAEQQPVDRRHVDLPALLLGRVPHGQVGQEAEAHGLPRHRVGAGDHRLRGDDGGQRGQDDHRDARPAAGRAGRTGCRSADLSLQHERALAEVVQRQAREDDEEPGPADRRPGRSGPCRRRAPRRR